MATAMLGERRDLERFVQTHTCLCCGPEALLVVRWNGKENNHQVYCPKCGNTEHFAKPRSLTQMWKDDPGSVPITVANRMAHKHRESIESEIEGLPDDLAATIREKYLGLPDKTE